MTIFTASARALSRTTTIVRTQQCRLFQTCKNPAGNSRTKPALQQSPGSVAFADREVAALSDLYYNYAVRDVAVHGREQRSDSYLDLNGVRSLLNSIGERPDDSTLHQIFRAANSDGDGKLKLNEFLRGADMVLGGAPARIVLVVGGPGSGKGVLCRRLAEECGIVHLSGGEMLRDEVSRGTCLGQEVAEIMDRGDLVSSAVITTLVRRRMRDHPGARVLLDGFPRSLENAHDLVELCGVPELALHMDCDDTVMLERIMARADSSETKRNDGTLETALRRLRTYHRYHNPTMEWLRTQHVPIVNLDCNGSIDNVWQQLLAIGRLMRPVTQFRSSSDITQATNDLFDDDSQYVA